MRDVVEAIVRALVDDVDQVHVSMTEGERVAVIEVVVAKRDLGKLIGRGGATADAIRTLLAAASGKARRRFVLEIVED